VTGEKPDWGYPRPMSRRLLALSLALLALPFAAHAQDVSAGCPTPVRLDDGWTLATPKDAGFDPGKLCPLDKFIGRWSGAKIHGVVVVRHGKLVLERYYKGAPPPESGRTGVVARWVPFLRSAVAAKSNVTNVRPHPDHTAPGSHDSS
jgi:hypothetical protein